MIPMLQIGDRTFKITLGISVKKVDNMQEEIGNVSRDTEILIKN